MILFDCCSTDVTTYNSILNYLNPILLGGLAGVIVVIIYDWIKRNNKRKNLYKGCISEMEVNKEYLKHNHELATSIKNYESKPSIFILVRNDVCVNLLTSGEIKLNKIIRKKCDHYLVTLDHLNQMITTIEQTEKNTQEYEVALERIIRYCRKEQGDFADEFDYISKHINSIQHVLLEQKKYLKNYFNK